MNTSSEHMRRTRVRPIYWLVPVLVLAFLGLGCSLTGLLAAPTSTPVPAATMVPAPTAEVAADTPTTAAPPVTPLADEFAAANELESQVITVYDTIAPAVVNITNRVIVYDRYMRAVPQEQGSGSGFLYDRQGHIVTNFHVVEGAKELLVTLADGRVLEGELVGTDPTNDLAVIRIAADGLPEPVALADSDTLRVGQFVVAIGNPFGLQQTLTTGVISALGRVIQSPEDNRFIGQAIQTDAAINPGNSGGPLLDLSGRLIGVNSQIISPSRASAGIGFAVSSNTVRRVVPALIERGYYPHPWLGTYMWSLTPDSAGVFREAEMNLPVDTGILILQVVDGGPADQAGLRGGDRVVTISSYRIPLDGDVIIAVDEVRIDNYENLTLYLDLETVVGDTVQVTVLRDGQELTLPVVLGERPREEP